ncbi:MAG: serine protease [Oleiphilaceae bacterium]|jgi:serine protease
MKSILKTKLIATIILASVTSANAETFNLVVKDQVIKSSQAKNSSVKPKGIKTISVKADSLADALAITKASGKYETVELDAVIQTNSKPRVMGRSVSQQSSMDGAPNDPYFQEQTYWNRQNSGLYTAAANDILGANTITVPFAPVRIGVVDGGFFDDFQDIVIKGGVSFVERPTIEQAIGDSYLSPESDRDCETGHGTGILGIIGAKTNDGYGMAGIADADLYAVRALRCGSGVLSDVSKAIRYLIGETVDGIPGLENPVHIISISLGAHIESGGCPTYIEDAVKAANDLGVTIVAAGGNFKRDVATFFPASCDGVVSVAAIDSDTGDKFKTSNYGADMDISAQGSYIASYNTGYPEQVGYWEETSFSAPIVTGSFALAYQAAPSLDRIELERLIKLTSTKLKDATECELYGCGSGLLNAKNFVDAALSFENKEFGDIDYLLNSSEYCDKNVYLASNNVKARLCDSYLVTLGVTNNSLKTSIAVYQVTKGEALSFDSAEKIADVTRASFVLASLDIESFDYGYTMCENGNCETGDILPLKSTTDAKPIACD